MEHRCLIEKEQLEDMKLSLITAEINQIELKKSGKIRIASP